MMLLHASNKLIALQAGCIVDGEETPAWRASRVAHNHEGQGLQRKIAKNALRVGRTCISKPSR